jgi:hypothetical protein
MIRSEPIQIGNKTAYFDVFDAVSSDMENEIQDARKQPGISIQVDDRGIHDRGWRYTTYKVISSRQFAPRVEAIAQSLHTMAAKKFRQMLPGNANDVCLF